MTCVIEKRAIKRPVKAETEMTIGAINRHYRQISTTQNPKKRKVGHAVFLTHDLWEAQCKFISATT